MYQSAARCANDGGSLSSPPDLLTHGAHGGEGTDGRRGVLHRDEGTPRSDAAHDHGIASTTASTPAMMPDTRNGTRPVPPHASPAHTPAISEAPPASPWYIPSPDPTRSFGSRSAIQALPTPSVSAVYAPYTGRR